MKAIHNIPAPPPKHEFLGQWHNFGSEEVHYVTYFQRSGTGTSRPDYAMWNTACCNHEPPFPMRRYWASDFDTHCTQCEGRLMRNPHIITDTEELIRASQP